MLTCQLERQGVVLNEALQLDEHVVLRLGCQLLLQGTGLHRELVDVLVNASRCCGATHVYRTQPFDCFLRREFVELQHLAQ